MGPLSLSFISATARRKPSRSLAALPGEGGPCGRSERNGKSKRSTAKPHAAKALDISTSSIDWQFAPKWDVYLGVMSTSDNGGLANGFLERNNIATTAGLRLRF